MATGWDTRQLLEPVTADQPCGESLEDTPLLASFDGFRVFGQSTALDPPPDWVDLKKRAEEALARSKDLRLLAHLGSALLRTDGLRAFAGTLSVASCWLDTFWDETYPLVTDDIIFRRNALNCFADPVAIVDGIRRAPLAATRLGTVTLRDLEIAAGQVPPREGETPPDAAQLDAVLRSVPADELQSLGRAVADAMAAVKNIEARMRDADAEAAPDLDLLASSFVKLNRFLAPHLGADGDAAGEADAEADGGAPARAMGPIRSRDDAVRALDAVADYFRRTEPSSPVPLFVERAKRLVSKDFLEVLADVAPDALAQARAAGGLRQSE